MGQLLIPSRDSLQILGGSGPITSLRAIGLGVVNVRSGLIISGSYLYICFVDGQFLYLFVAQRIELYDDGDGEVTYRRLTTVQSVSTTKSYLSSQRSIVKPRD